MTGNSLESIGFCCYWCSVLGGELLCNNKHSKAKDGLPMFSSGGLFIIRMASTVALFLKIHWKTTFVKKSANETKNKISFHLAS